MSYKSGVPEMIAEIRGWKAGTSDDSHRMVWLLNKAADEIERLEKTLQPFERLLRMVPKRPNAITYEHGWILLDELQAIADAYKALEEGK